MHCATQERHWKTCGTVRCAKRAASSCEKHFRQDSTMEVDYASCDSAFHSLL